MGHDHYLRSSEKKKRPESTPVQTSSRKCTPPKVAKVFVPKSNLWILSGIMSSFLFAISNFMSASYSHKPILGRDLALIGGMIYSAIYFTVKIVRNYRNQKKDKPIIDWSWVTLPTLVYLVISSLLAGASGYAVMFTFKYATCAGINHGIISTFFSFTSVFVAIFAWILFNEKISAYHAFGICTVIASVFLLAMYDEKNSNGKSRFSMQILAI
jgi:drug/metabolite transporter (DMT)-like permease